MTRLLASVLCCTLTLFAAQSRAALIDQYNFDDGTINDSSGNGAGLNDLSVIGAPPDLSGGSYFSDGKTGNFIETTGGGGASDFTVSVWVKGALSDQGGFQGIISNQDATDNFSWQFDSNGGQYRLASHANADNPTITLGAARANEWDHLVLQKFGGGNSRVFLNGAQVGGDLGFNPGGLQEYRLGINRNADNDNSFLGLIDNVQVFNDSTTSAAALFAAGPGNVNPRPVAALNYDATVDNNGNGTWEEVNQFLGNANAQLNNVNDAGTAFRFNGNGAANIGPNTNFETGLLNGDNPPTAINFTGKSASFEVLFSADDLSRQEVLFEMGGSGNGMSLLQNTGNIEIVAKTGGDRAIAGGGVGNLSAQVERGAFLHAVGVIDVDNDLLSMFVNGELVSQLAFTGNDWAGGNAGGIGGNVSDVGGTLSPGTDLDLFADFLGEIQAFRLYEGALTAADVQALAADHLLTIPEPATGLLIMLAGGACLRRRREAA